jgi:outer membrane receptor protein involved in Fe transport
MITPTPIARSSRRTLRGLLLAVFSILTLGVAAYGASKKSFDLPAGDAAKTLKSFSDQSGEQIVYPVEQVRGLQTNAVQGELTSREALDAMLEKTGLVAVQDEKTDALAVRKAAAPDTGNDAAARKDALFRPTRATAVDPSTESAKEPEIVVLSPFEVTAGRESGYAAADTLAGNRLNTALRDVGSAITVVTAQMLRDLNATDNETLLQYTTNTEVGNIYGNMANAGNGTQLDETSKFTNPNANTRVRGLAAADSTMDYILTDIPWDGYNVDRIDFQRGPNAILFGLGSPAGIINAGTKTAGFRDRGDIQFRYSRFGSARTTLDVNRVLLANELAIHLDGLNDHELFQQKPAFQHSQRVYGALRYEPRLLNQGWAHTTFKANFEQGKVDSNRPRTLTPGDVITPWFYSGTATGYDANGVPFTYNNLNKKGFDARGLQDTNIASIGAANRGEFVKAYNNTNGLGNGTLNPYWQPWLGGQYAAGYFGGVMAIFDSGAISNARLFNAEPTTSRGLNTAGAIDGSIGGIPNDRMSSITIYRDVSKKVNLPGAKFGLTRNLTLSDPSIFNFYDNLIDGPNKSEWQNFHHFNLNLSTTVLNGDAGVEVVYDRQHYDNGQLVFMSDKGQQIYIDDIQTEADGTANPNFGRPFISNSNNGNSMSADREATRLTGYLKHDFDGGQNHSLLTRLLGRHVLTGLYSYDSRKQENRSWTRYSTDLAYKDFITATATNVTVDDNRRIVYPAIYLGPSLVNASSAAGANIPNPTTLLRPVSGSVRAFDSTWVATGVNPGDVWNNPNFPVGDTARISTQSENPANYRGWINTPVTIYDSEQGFRDNNTTGASLNKVTTESQAINWQGYFWRGAIVGMYGYRTDTAKSWTLTATRNSQNQVLLDPSVYSLPQTHIRVKDSSNSWSVVAHLSELLGDRVPIQISAFYNKSQNFQPLAGRVGPLNNPLTPPKGTTTDYGLLLGTRDGRYSFKINKYETKVTNASGTSGFNSFYLGQLFTDYQPEHNIFKYHLGGTTMDTAGQGDPSRWTYQPNSGQSADQAAAAEVADIAGWEQMISSLPAAFFTAYKIDIDQVKSLTYTTPNGLSIPEDNVSKGYELELYAQPVRNLRLTLNASKQEAVRNNVGDAAFNSLVNQINTALNNTAAGTLRGNSSATAGTALQAWNANFWASWLSVKGQEGNAVTELRKWRANLIANYDFTSGLLKGVNVGAGYRWQDKVVIGYRVKYYVGTTASDPFLATTAQYDLSKPFYGPSEGNIDLWVGYGHRLNAKLNWRIQVNVRNVGKGNSLIPITVQPDGTVAAWRIAPTQVWSVTNTVEF